MKMLRMVTRGTKDCQKPVVENCERGSSKVIDLYLKCDRTQKFRIGEVTEATLRVQRIPHRDTLIPPRNARPCRSGLMLASGTRTNEISLIFGGCREVDEAGGNSQCRCSCGIRL